MALGVRRLTPRPAVPGRPRAPHPFLAGPLPLALAHRGAGPLALRNTRPALQAAVALGYRHVETDVHATSDGVVVLLHDPVLETTTDRAGRLRDLPWREVARARVAGAEPLLRLDEVLAEWPDLRLNIDVKAWQAVDPVADLLRRPGVAERVCLASFSDARRAAVLRRAGAVAGPGVAWSLGVSRTALAWLAGTAGSPRLTRVVTSGAVALQVPVTAGPLPVVTRRVVDAAHAAGLHVHAWTVDDPREMGRLVDLGVDGVVTDAAEVLREVLVARGVWRPGPASSPA